MMGPNDDDEDDDDQHSVIVCLIPACATLLRRLYHPISWRLVALSPKYLPHYFVVLVLLPVVGRSGKQDVVLEAVYWTGRSRYVESKN